MADVTQIDDTRFDRALVSVLQTEKRDFPTMIGGLNVASGVDFAVWSPVDHSIRFGLFQEPEEGIAKEAVSCALKAFQSWSATASSERIAIFRAALDDITAQRYRLAASVTISSGMTRVESMAEVDALISIIEQGIADLEASSGGNPKGPWAILSAHNSPLASPMGFASCAMLAGCTVVVMPSQLCPTPVYEIYSILVKAGLPDGVMNIIVDRKKSTTPDLANDERLAGVVATGSGERLEDLMFMMIDDELGFINELKGVNPILVWRPSNVKEAARQVLESAFAFSGQRLYSCSKVILNSDDQKAFVSALIEEAKDLCIDDPAEAGTFAGPLISEKAMGDFLSIVDAHRDALVFGGKQVRKETTENGSYVVPAILMGLDVEDELNYTDTGLPVLVIQIATNAEEALELLFQTECGLSAGVFSKDQSLVESVKETAAADTIFVNNGNRSMRPGIKARVSAFRF
jgi:acyl-CoA reductase-like NAD-dependent aldehyde dehydrogenase